MKTSNLNYPSELIKQVNEIEIFLLPFARGGATLFGVAEGLRRKRKTTPRRGCTPAPLLVKGGENV